jgi:outer membrane protein X
MKKLLCAICVACLGLTASAQRQGDVGFGVNFGVAPVLEDGADFSNFGIGVKVQYNITDPIRLNVAADYWCESHNFSVGDVLMDVHYMIPVANRFSLYPLAGIGYGRIKYTWGSNDFYDMGIVGPDGYVIGNTFSQSLNRFLFDVGVGAEYNLTSNFAASLEIKYQYMKDFSRMPISIGFAYKF